MLSPALVHPFLEVAHGMRVVERITKAFYPSDRAVCVAQSRPE